METLSNFQKVVFNKHDLIKLLENYNLEGLLNGNDTSDISKSRLDEVKIKLHEIKKSKERYLKNIKLLEH